MDTRTTSDPRCSESRLDSDPEDWLLVRRESLEEGDRCTSYMLCRNKLYIRLVRRVMQKCTNNSQGCNQFGTHCACVW